MTNLEKWQLLTSDLEAPQNYIDFVWYFTISSALERRVFFGDPERPLFCNQYLLLVGPPGIGKGTSMREGKRLLQRYPLTDPNGTPLFDREKQPRALFHSFSDSITFEALVWDMVECTKAIYKPDGGIAAQAAGYFLLEELSSLFRKNKSEDVARLLLNLYDCIDYEYRTRTKSTARIRKGCLNLIAGTTMDFVRTAEQSGMLGEGLFSRTLIIYADAPRHIRFSYANLSAEQKLAQASLQDWLRDLSKLYGRIEIPPETNDWLESWWAKEYEHLAAFSDDKLMNFFSRRKVQVHKLAAAIHYSEHKVLSPIPIPTWELAAHKVRSLEDNIIKIARRTGRSQTYSIQERLVQFICQQPRTHMEVVDFLSPNLQYQEIISMLEGVQASGKVVQQGQTWSKA